MMGYTNSPGRDSAGPAAGVADGAGNLLPGAAATALLDIVVFAGGESSELKPLTAFEQKCMLRVCSRPLIWYCLAPWVEAGFRTFFIVVNEDYATLRTYLSREFGGVDFHFVFVPLMIGEHNSTTCDGVKAYVEFKEQLRAGTTDGGSLAEQDGGREDSPTAARKSAVASASSPAGGKASPLRAERAALPSFDRDALLLSCDTILAGVDVDAFVSSFYSSMASVSAMFFRPLSPESTAGGSGEGTGAKEKGHGRKGKQPHGGASAAGPQRRSFAYSFTCAAYEETDVIASMAAGGATATVNESITACSSNPLSDTMYHGAGGTFFAGGAAGPHCVIQHRRLHYMYPLDERPELRITMAFAARRPNLTFAADVVDAHVYLVRHWVLDFIAESAGVPDASVRKFVMPLLARSQHAVVNTAESTFLTPDQKIGHSIPTHWMYTRRGGDLSIDTMNAAKGPLLPEKADNLRVFCTIYNENAQVPMKIYRISTRDNYQAVNQEIISMKCQMLHLLDEPPNHGTGARSGGGGGGNFSGGGPLSHGVAATAGIGAGGSTATARGLSLLRAPSAEALYGSGIYGNPHASASALSHLLPDNPFTLREKLGSQQVYIVGSFVDSAPPANTYITRSVIGPNVTIGPGARITDSVILANVDIGAKAVIANSIIGTSAVVDGERRVTGCVVSPRWYVEEDQQDTIVE